MGGAIPQVFLCVGQQFLAEQRTLITNVVKELHSDEVNEYCLTSDHYNVDAPLLPVQNALKSCDGALVVAFPRIRIQSGIEFRELGNELDINNRNVATPWLQIEATLAYAAGVPMLILVDDRLHPEGILNPHHSAYGAIFYNMAESQKTLSTKVTDAIKSFAGRVEMYASGKLT